MCLMHENAFIPPDWMKDKELARRYFYHEIKLKKPLRVYVVRLIDYKGNIISYFWRQQYWIEGKKEESNHGFYFLIGKRDAIKFLRGLAERHAERTYEIYEDEKTIEARPYKLIKESETYYEFDNEYAVGTFHESSPDCVIYDPHTIALFHAIIPAGETITTGLHDSLDLRASKPRGGRAKKLIQGGRVK